MTFGNVRGGGSGLFLLVIGRCSSDGCAAFCSGIRDGRGVGGLRRCQSSNLVVSGDGVDDWPATTWCVTTDAVGCAIGNICW